MKTVKIILIVLLCVSLIALCGCKNEKAGNNSATNGTVAGNGNVTTPSNGTQTDSGNSSFDDVDWEGPIDVDEDAETLPPESQDPTKPDATQPDVTDPQVTEPDATIPGATDPVDPTQPPAGGTIDPDTGRIELPYIPG